jgi:hypothetical protein
LPLTSVEADGNRRPRAFELRHAKAMLRVIAYGNHVLRIGLAALRGSGNFGLCTSRRRARTTTLQRP